MSLLAKVSKSEKIICSGGWVDDLCIHVDSDDVRGDVCYTSIHSIYLHGRKALAGCWDYDACAGCSKNQKKINVLIRTRIRTSHWESGKAFF